MLILDDLAYLQRPDAGPTEPVRSPEYEVPDSGHDPATGTVAVPLDAKTVIDGFADLGSVCAVVRPLPEESFQERFAKAAARSDIVVLDWKIAEYYGDVTLAVIREILSDDAQSRRLRLMAIYTGETNLEEIAEDVRKTVDEFYSDHTLVKNGPFRIEKGPVLVVVLAKDSRAYEHIPSLRNQVVSEENLADRLVEEFSILVGGILRNMALEGISNIRSNSHRILAKFNSELDAAYLGHRVLLQNPPDAEGHVVTALGSEVLSVLEDGTPGEQAAGDVIDDWISSAGERGVDLSTPFDFQSTDATSAWRELLSKGIDASDVTLQGGKSQLKKRVTEAFTRDDRDARRADDRFSALLSLKARYPRRGRRLAIGTILCRREGGRRRYFLCLQPKCDSVRIDRTRGFPLLALEVVHEQESNRPFRIVVELKRDKWERLHVKAKPSELEVRPFQAGPNPPGEVLATPRLGGFYFSDTEGRRYWWVAEMKDEHALKVAGDVAAALARPGPNDSEWLRLASQR